MPLNLHRRHRLECEGDHPEESRSGEFEERKKSWKRCSCQIFASGTLNGNFKRRRTGKNTWEEAKEVVGVWEAAGTWEPGPSISEPVPPPIAALADAGTSCVSIQAAAEAYLANRIGRQIADSTLRKYKTLVKQLMAFAGNKGYVKLDQFTVPDMNAFYALWKDGIRAKAKKLERLKGFFKFCKKRKWIAENPAEDLEAPVGSSTPAGKMPFTDAELVKIYSACDRLPTIRWTTGVRSGEWGGEDVKTLIMLLVWTGLRISDGATFDMSRVSPHPEGGANVLIRMKKTGKFKSEPLYLGRRLALRTPPGTPTEAWVAHLHGGNLGEARDGYRPVAAQDQSCLGHRGSI